MAKWGPGKPAYNKIPRPEFNKTTHEFCTKCRQVLPHSAFPHNRSEACKDRSGLHYWCTKCNTAGSKRYEVPGTPRWRQRRDNQAISARRRAVASGRRPAEYLERPIHFSRPALYEQRLRVLGWSDEDIADALERLEELRMNVQAR